jgi:DNA-binding winged helix-turn-helix (wHTH) protein/tetratricopeptide (TPR) repeat protein
VQRLITADVNATLRLSLLLLPNDRRPAHMEATARPARVLRFGVFEVDMQSCELRKHGIRIRLQDQPFQILLILLERPGELVSRDEVRSKLWAADTFVDFDHNLNKAMTKLRSALGDCADNPRFIETLHRKGYRFIAPVSWPTDTTEVPVHEASPVLVPAGIAPVDEVSVRPHETLPRRPRPAQRWWVIAFATILVACSGALVYPHTRLAGGILPAAIAPASNAPPGSITPRRSVAVLGFKNLSGRAEEAWLSTALSDWLSTDLSSGDQLRTVSTEDVARMESELPLPEFDRLEKNNLGRIGRNLNAEYVVVGAYAVIGNGSDGQIRLDLRLQDTRTGETVAAVAETGTESHLFSLVSRAGERLRAGLGIEGVTREEAAEVAVALPANHHAARLYSEGLEKLRIFEALAARDLLEQAIAIDPRYALSHAALATAWAKLGYDEKAELEAKEAFDLSSNLPRPERLLVEGRYDALSRHWDKAINIYRALFEFFPDSLDYGLALADAQVNGGKGTEALATIEALRRLPPPLNEDPRLDLADDRAAESLGDFRRDLDSAMKAGEKARATGATLLLAQALADECWAYNNLGEPDEAVAAAEASKRLFAAIGDRRGVGLATNTMGITLENKGDAAGAKRMYEDGLSIYRKIGNRLGVASDLDNLGDVLMALGDLNGSRRSYEESLATYREIGHEDGVALAKGGLGILLLAMGDHQRAKKDLQESLDVCLRLGDKSKAAFDLAGLGKALRAEGDVDGARKYDARALTVFKEIGDRSSAAQTQLAMAELLIDEGNARPAVKQVREAADEFRKEKEADSEAVADAILARALLAEAKIGDAQNAIHEADSALTRSDRQDAKLLVVITSAQVRAASGNPADEAQAASMIERVLSESRRSGFVNYEFEARLVLAALELRSGSSSTAHAHLQELEREAGARGLGRIAREADSLQRTSVAVLI